MDLDSTTNINSTNRETSKTLVSRKRQERGASLLFKCLTFLPIVLFIVILVVLIVRSLPILQQKSVFDLLLGKVWRPSEGEFGFLPFIAGSVWVTVFAMMIAAPVSIMCAIYLSEYATSLARTILKPLIDILAAIPSVVYGLWGVLVIVPWVGNTLSPFLEKTLWFIPFFQSKNPTGYSILGGWFGSGGDGHPIYYCSIV